MKKQKRVSRSRCFGQLRLLALILAVCLLFSGFPVSAEAAEDFKPTAFRKGQVLLKNKDFTVTAKDLQKQKNSGNLVLTLNIKNTSQNPLRFQDPFGKIENTGISLSMFQTIRPGNQTTVQLYIDMLAVAAARLKQVEQLDLTFDVYNENTRQVQYKACEITVPIGAVCDLEYTSYEACLYEEDSFQLYLLGSAQPNPHAAPRMIFRLRNSLDGPLTVRNENVFSVNQTEYSFYVHETAAAYSYLVFTAMPLDDFFEDVSGNTAVLNFPLQICTDNLNPLIDLQLRVHMNRDAEITRADYTSAKSRAYEISMKEYHQKKNMFMGTFHDYEPDPEYIAVLRKKYPNDGPFSDCGIHPYVSELLTLYLDDLEKAGYTFGIIERADLCTETSYVVELTEKGNSVIQVALSLNEYDPKSAKVITLTCASDHFRDTQTRNHYLNAMWLAYFTLNNHLTPETHGKQIQNGESTTSKEYGVMLRGQFDGLGYVQTTNDKEMQLTISYDLSLPIFAGMKSGATNPKPTENLKVGDTFFFGSFEQDNNAANGPESIQWVVLDKEAGRILAISSQALDSQRFHKTAGSITWKNASVRTWLNQDFYNSAFDAEEKALISPQKVEVLAGTDKVFLLSREEAEAYFPTAAERRCQASAYAVSRNAYVNDKTGCSWWLLRTSGTQKGTVMSVNSDGTMDYKGGNVKSDRGTVRPAMWIRTTG